MNTKLRKKYLIYPKFQLTLIIIQSAIAITCLAAVIIKIQMFFTHLKNVGLSVGFAADHPFSLFLSAQEASLYPGLFVIFGIAILVISVSSLILSHKLAGPIVRMKSYFFQISETKQVAAPLKFRERDFFRELPEIINLAIKAIQSKSDHK